MGLIHAGLLDDGGREEQKRRHLAEGEAIFMSDRRLSLAHLGFNTVSLDKQSRAHA